MSTKFNPKGMSNVTALLLMVITAMSVVIIMFCIQNMNANKNALTQQGFFNAPNVITSQTITAQNTLPPTTGIVTPPNNSYGQQIETKEIKETFIEKEQSVKIGANNANAENDSTIKGCVVIQSPYSNGTGFLYEKNGAIYVVTCAHVIESAPVIYIRDLEGHVLKVKEVLVAKDRDVAFIVIEKPEHKIHTLLAYEDVSSLTTLPDVICYGNTGGQGIIRPNDGKIKGIGPVEIEIDAPVMHGDSGGPVVLRGTDKVIGLNVRVSAPNESPAVTHGTPYENNLMRRMAVRFDNLKKEDITKVEWGKDDPFDSRKLNEIAQKMISNNDLELAYRLIVFNAVLNNDSWAKNKTYELILALYLQSASLIQDGDQAKIKQFYDEFYKICKRGADDEIPSAQLCLGLCYLLYRDYDNGFAYIKKAADAGYEEAWPYMGLCYIQGYGTARVPSVGISWYEKAANAGKVEAQRFLGEYYFKETGIYNNYLKAFQLFKKAADGGDVKAMEWLGYLYANGWGTPVDLKKSIEYYENAFNKGSPYAAYQIGLLFYNKRDYTNARKYLEFAWQYGQIEDARQKLQMLQYY